MFTTPKGTLLRSRRLNCFRLPFFSAAPAAPACAFAIVSSQFSVASSQLPQPGSRELIVSEFPVPDQLPTGSRQLGTAYVFAVDFFFCAIVPLRGPLRV